MKNAESVLTANSTNIVMLRGACLWMIMALILAWCMVGLNFGVPGLPDIFQGKQTRVLQAHIDFLLMSALILGYYAARVPFPWHVRWAMVVGAFTNSSLFLLMGIFPVLDTAEPPQQLGQHLFQYYLFASLITTSYGFGKGAVLILKSTLGRDSKD
ncbi:hypothetical protein SAMN05192560_1621 [Methylobacillus rhizosphaerae]|uniref:Hydroxylaminobenzene mutase n=1 Tax=Methylobacillus rhizosphaerae TaxID=551994 RepID=A0A239A2C9_9PROT|nr:hypothetical protein [Methylobacillus rhizosphaerae]SNR89268.1 hypothetical protein SAMN05192560_1621 [Methylobacillus rhizosphaerae]